MWHGVPFARQRRPIVGVLRMCWLLPGSFDCFCCPRASVHSPPPPPPNYHHEKVFSSRTRRTARYPTSLYGTSPTGAQASQSPNPLIMHQLRHGSGACFFLVPRFPYPGGLGACRQGYMAKRVSASRHVPWLFLSVGGSAHRSLTTLCPPSLCLAYPYLPTHPSFPLVGCANAASGLSHCSVSGPHGGGRQPWPLATCIQADTPYRRWGSAPPDGGFWALSKALRRPRDKWGLGYPEGGPTLVAPRCRNASWRGPRAGVQGADGGAPGGFECT